MSKNTRSNSIKRDSSTLKRNSKSNLADRFEFYARIVKLVILRKDDTDVVSKYSTWLKKLRKHPNETLKYDYVKLLVMGLNHPVPVCPFNEYPPDVIEPLEGEWIVNARNIFYNGDPSCRPIVLNPPIMTAVSDDKCQFAAYQEIPNAGLQCYYAQSDEPLYEWFFKHDSLSIPPENPVQAIPLDWERSLAGIHVAPPKIPSKRKTSSSPIQRPSSLSVIGSKVEEKRDFCKILSTYQEMFNITTHFKWNEKSLLTGDTIPGSDLCIDWFIHEHERTQLDIDEEMIRSFDKLYPHNFRLSARPELLEGLVRKMDCAEENAKCMDAECAKVEEEDCKYR
ncbi:uncharacterized protein LOC100571758 [Acyrthosiphon pisum]|uniref:DUF4485 domain-containing protein n=1 Tax=Acyrthosiphon pisum TaxID=7029 RepID=A0A8R1W3R2_ACYPI|nr:uncharacterized protein LOC100571758 [Acyrthosiphon pisum]|eukprot:XP_003240416.1 PREDICTED: uncharacterized protein LOC100571758 [Acyrthosiphon pisum]